MSEKFSQAGVTGKTLAFVMQTCVEMLPVMGWASVMFEICI